MARFTNRMGNPVQGRSRGFTLIEVLIALALFAIIGIVFAGGLGTASRSVLTADVRTNAESLARTEMEYVKNLPPAGNYTPKILPQYQAAGYNATIVAYDLQPGLQKITVTVSHEDRGVITLEGYKVAR